MKRKDTTKTFIMLSNRFKQNISAAMWKLDMDVDTDETRAECAHKSSV